MRDAWEAAYTPTDDPEAYHIPKGWSWGFPADSQQVNPSDIQNVHHADGEGLNVFRNDLHRRRIDKVHLSQHILPSLTKCYTHFLANSDHKAVVVTISPTSPMTPPRAGTA